MVWFTSCYTAPQATARPLTRIRSLHAFEVPVRLRQRVRHASHERTSNQTLIVRCELSSGEVGWGEGLARPYVTGESTGSVRRHLQQTDFTPLADAVFDSPASALETLDGFRLADVAADEGIQPRECFGNSVRCAVELSLLDAVTRAARVPIGRVVDHMPEAAALRTECERVRYSGVITSARGWKQWRSAFKMKVFGFAQVKVKVGTPGVDDKRLLGRIRRVLGERVDLRLDANEAWASDEVADRLQPLLPFRISSLEQPVPHAQVQDLGRVRSQVSIPVMLDESLCSRADAERAIASRTCDLFNLRISKCGGFSACVRLAVLASEKGIGFQLGCQVGETGILSAAGRHFACNIDQIRYLEGSYDRFLVRDRLTHEDLTFGYGGWAKALNGPGLGVTVIEDEVRSRAIWQRRLV